jgi:hypothetical protein
MPSEWTTPRSSRRAPVSHESTRHASSAAPPSGSPFTTPRKAKAVALPNVEHVLPAVGDLGLLVPSLRTLVKHVRIDVGVRK